MKNLNIDNINVDEISNYSELLRKRIDSNIKFDNPEYMKQSMTKFDYNNIDKHAEFIDACYSGN